jgi:hypothetical protein
LVSKGGDMGMGIQQFPSQLDKHLANKANPHQVTAAQTGALVSVDGVSNPGGNIDLVAGANIAITPDNTNKKITIAGTGIWPNADAVDGVHVTGSSTSGLRKITISTADPSGGVDGDVWFKYA